MVPDVVPPPPPPPMPSATYVPPKTALTIVKTENLTSPPKNPVATNDGFDNVINEIKNKSGTLRKTKRKEVECMEDYKVPQVNLKSVTTAAKSTFKNEILINVENATPLLVNNGTTNSVKDSTGNQLNGTVFQLRRPSDFLNGTKPELPTTNKEVSKPQLPPKTFLNGTSQDNKSTATNKHVEKEKPSPVPSNVCSVQPPQRKVSLVTSTIQRLTSTEPDSPTETKSASPFKRNQVLTRSTSGGISSTIRKLERQNSTTDTEARSNGTTPLSFQRSNSVRQKINQMNRVEQPKGAIKDGTQTVGRRPMVPRPNLPRPSNDTMKLLNELHNPSVARVPVPIHNQNGNAMRLENEEARVGTTVNVADANGTVTASDPNVKKLVYNTYRNFLGAYNGKANTVVTNQNGTKVVQDKGVGEQLGKITQNGNINKLTGRAIQKTHD